TPVEACAKMLVSTLQPRPHRFDRYVQPCSYLSGLEALEVPKQHCLPIGLVQIEHGTDEDLLRLCLRGEIDGGRGPARRSRGCGLVMQSPARSTAQVPRRSRLAGREPC